ncbi:hypothetical protein GTY65_10275 [Streptomyces sp. SID8379]|nr:hypothetical protein [Streptomyces sp. SID8379]
MPRPGTTAVLALLPEADPLLELAAAVDARVVRPGVPAHAALLYPWLPADQVGERELARLRAALPVGRVPIRLAEVERAGGFVGIPLPELGAMATAVRAAFPEQVPYGGRFGQDPPVHVTVALDVDPGVSGAAGVAADIADRVAGRLPISAEVAALQVVTLGSSGWRRVAEVPLAD